MGLGKSEQNGALALIQKAYEAINSELLQSVLTVDAPRCGGRLQGEISLVRNRDGAENAGVGWVSFEPNATRVL